MLDIKLYENEGYKVKCRYKKDKINIQRSIRDHAEISEKTNNFLSKRFLEDHL